MALVKRLDSNEMERNFVHGEVEATYTIFSDDANVRHLQIDTYGSPQREIPGKKSQSIQFGPEGIAELRRVLSQL